jgi:hypothetical protein
MRFAVLSFRLHCWVRGLASAAFVRIYSDQQSEFLAVRPQAFMRDRFEPLQNPGLSARVAANALVAAAVGASHHTF